MDKKPKKILVARTDRIGDLIVSTPVFKVLRDAYPDAHIAAMVNPYTRDIMVNNPYIDEVIIYDATGSHIKFSGLIAFAKELRKKRFDTAVVLFSNFRLGLLTFLARIPKRIAPATKLAQIFYTDRVVQRRSRALKHEGDYNLDLLEALGITNEEKEVILVTDDKAEATALDYLNKEGLADAMKEKKLIGIHPGSGNSAKNWRPKRYAELADRLIKGFGYSIVLSGSHGERPLLEEVKASMTEEPAFFISESILEFAALLKKQKVLVSSSTGPMHMAAAVGTPTVSLFCPIRVTTPIRWGPIGNPQRILLPDAPQCEKCIGEECEYFDCMDRITIDDTVKAIIDLTGEN